MRLLLTTLVASWTYEILGLSRISSSLVLRYFSRLAVLLLTLRWLLFSHRLSLINFLNEHASVGLDAVRDQRLIHILCPSTPCFIERDRDDVDVPKLEFEGVACSSIEEGGDREVKLALKVTLLVVFLHLYSHPFEVENRAFGWSCMVGAIKRYIHYQLLILLSVLRELLRSDSALE